MRHANHLPVELIQNHGQIPPTLVGREIGDITRPHLIGGGSREVSLQQVRGNEPLVFAVGGNHELSLAPGFDAVLLQHAPHALLADTDTPGQQFFPLLGASKASLLMRLLAPGLDGWSAPLRRMLSKKPLTLTPSTSQARDTGKCFLYRAIQAYFTLKPARSSP
jgi:hypothetical protein